MPNLWKYVLPAVHKRVSDDCNPAVKRIGIVGTGDIVRTLHLPVLLNSPKVRVAWVADRDRSRAEAVGRAFRVPMVPLPEDISKLPHSDVVLIATPLGSRDIYLESLKERALYVEKPFSRSGEHHRRICGLFSPNRLACGFQRRCFAPTILVKELIETQPFGLLRSIDFGWGGRGFVVGSGYVGNLQLSGGGVLLDNAIHGLDLVLFVCGARTTSLRSVQMRIDNGFDIHTRAEIEIMGDSIGAVPFRIHVSCLEETTNRFDFRFEHAVVRWSTTSPGVFVKPNKGDNWQLLSPPAGRCYPTNSVQTSFQFWKTYLIGLDAAGANLTSAISSVLTTELIEALYQSGGAQ